MLMLAAIFVLRGRWRTVSGRHGVVAAGFSAVLALGASQVISSIWDRPRPYVTHPDAHLFIAPSPDPSFPSDHATAAFAIAVALLLRNRRVGIPALVMATVLAVARVTVGTHYPSDVLGGALLGTAVALLLWQSPVRRLLNALANRAGGVYDAVADRVLGHRPHPAA